MKLRAAQLTQHLQKHRAPIYFITGDELLQVKETLDTLRQYAKSHGFSERVSLTVDNTFDWQELRHLSQNNSLFAEQMLLELNLTTLKLGTKGSKALEHYCTHCPQNKLLIVRAPKLDAACQKTKWFKAIDAIAVIIQIWPIEYNQLAPWIKQRMQKLDQKASAPAIQLLAEAYTGNLLALAQTLEILHLSHDSKELSTDDIIAVISPSSRFNSFELVDAALQGHSRQVVKILQQLRAQNYEAILILWAVSRELRTLAQLASAKQQGTNVHALYRQLRIWDKRIPYVQQALQRHTLTTLYALIQQAAQVDAAIKGLNKSNPWQLLLDLCLELAGTKLITNQP